MDIQHEHKWVFYKAPDKLMCDCDTISDIKTILSNVAHEAAEQTRLNILTHQVRNRELKKPAFDAAYIYVSQNTTTIKPTQEQLF